MASPFRVELTGAASARAVHVGEENQLPAALDALGLRPPRPAVVVVGGAAGLDRDGMAGLRPLFAEAIAPVLQARGAAGVDGGTRSGVMRLLGEARAACGATFPLLGVVAAGPVKLPREQSPGDVATLLEPHHTHFVVVPGDEWGAESPWIARAATALAGSGRSVTVLVNGGEIAYLDVRHSVESARPVLVVSGSGGTADVLAAALSGGSADGRAAALVGSGLIRAVPMSPPAVLAGLLTAALG
ncbi:hypothetical protein [Mycobacterium sp. E787]|uniref:hypothetical protein n=1 Tax=Mycobacterium sp. E787 TaxID=1834150 RepID=UPI0007FCF6AC|nr:hypothetical protein [Mycobacterium sp. E787]OBI49287.1 hypothetical protein A5705_13600 [Mycobacterium sp. E787]